MRLKAILQDLRPSEFENLAAALFSRLIEAPVTVARSGFQFGADMGTSGRHGRRLRIECKRYADDTALNERMLRGELAQATQHDPALEAWILVATRAAHEQLEEGLTHDGAIAGVPVLIVDWKTPGTPVLLALCTCAPDVVGQFVSVEAEDLVRSLRAKAEATLRQLRRDVSSWSLGYAALRTAAADRLEEIWTSRQAAGAYFGQDTAGGAVVKRVRRTTVYDEAENWWTASTEPDTPLVITGFDGVGKTWAALDWLYERREDLPICLAIPSSSAAALTGASELSVKRFLADRLYELGGVREPEHWLRRLERLLKRPQDEAPVLLLFFDGLNQEPSLDWIGLFRMLQGPAFGGRVRVVASTRQHHFVERLSKLRNLLVRPRQIEVDLYDNAPGGELDKMLAFESLTRDDLHPDLLELTRNPRLFHLAIRFRDRLVEAGQVTVHRLLWEYGRDTLGVRAGRSFSETEWRAWLGEVAGLLRDGIRSFSMGQLAATTQRADLQPADIAARLSDIVDGQFTAPRDGGRFVLSPVAVAHALGAALVFDLAEESDRTSEAIEGRLNRWLDPIAGLDAPVEVLRAAVSIVIEEGRTDEDPLLSVLLTSWLQIQNLPDLHREEVGRLAPSLTMALIDVIERSQRRSQASARKWSVQALRGIPATNGRAWVQVVQRLTPWFERVSRGLRDFTQASEEFRRHRAERFIKRLGVDSSGPTHVLGLDLELVDFDDGVLQGTAIEILDGRPLASAAPIFERAAITSAITGSIDCWEALKWVCWFNEIDPEETATLIRGRAADVAAREPEPGVNPLLAARAAALMLWLTGFEADEVEANRIDSGLDRHLSYDADYLAHPARSWFTLERRHAADALLDRGVALSTRVGRVGELWFDPTFEPPTDFVAELVAAMSGFDVTGRHRVGMTTSEDSAFEDHEVALARCAPRLLADLQRRGAAALADRPADSRYWAAIHAHEGHLVLSPSVGAAARKLRLSSTGSHAAEEAFASNKLLFLEIAELDPRHQMEAIIAADLKFILHDFEWIGGTVQPRDWEYLLDKHGEGTPKQRHDLLVLLLMKQAALPERVWTWVQEIGGQADHDDRGLAFMVLANADKVRLGRWLLDTGWHWSADQHYWVNHHGSAALIASSTNILFEQIASRLAPWRLLEAVRLRGGDPAEATIAASMFGAVLAARGRDVIDLTQVLTMDRTDPCATPFTFSAEPRDEPDDDESPASGLGRAFDVEGRMRASREAQEVAYARVKAARDEGAGLYLANIAAIDFEPILQANVTIDDWLAGHVEVTPDFQRRVWLAELAYLSLCEALLKHQPERGAALWRALRRTITTKFTGRAGVDEMLHAVFRAPDSPAADALRLEQYGRDACNNDLALFELALAATLAGQHAWLTARIAEDEVAPAAWRRRRAVKLSEFLANNRLPVAGAWPDGEDESGYGVQRRLAARGQALEAAAHHWWEVFGREPDPERAYAAWVLFRRSADRRALAWMAPGLDSKRDAATRAKVIHAELNRGELTRAQNKRPDRGREKFLARTITTGIGPWRRE